MEDIRTVFWREWRGVFRHRGSRLRAVLTLLVPTAVFVIYLPWVSGERWFDGPPSVLASVASPLLIVILLVPDSFAGERERHTLATLLATRLPDRAILIGKLGFAVAAAFAVTLLVLLLGFAVANLAMSAQAGAAGMRFYSFKVLTADLGIGFLLALLAAATGVLTSSRARSVQEAQQLLSAFLFLPPALLGLVPPLLARFHPEWSVARVLGAVGSWAGVGWVGGGLAVVDLVVVYVVVAGFRRGRLLGE